MNVARAFTHLSTLPPASQSRVLFVSLRGKEEGRG